MPVEGTAFVNRKQLVDEVVSTLSNKRIRMGFAFYGKRRIGKTSLLKEVGRKLKAEKGIVVIYFSFWDLVDYNIEEFSKKFTEAVLEGFKEVLPIKYKIKDLLGASITLLRQILYEAKISILLANEIELLLRFEKKKEDIGAVIERIFSLPEQIAKEKNVRCILLLDEFPSIMDLKNGKAIGEGIIRKIRTISENQNNTILCVSGSIKKTMTITCLSSASAFYQQFLIREVKPLEINAIRILVKKNIGGKIDEEALKQLFLSTQGIPFYIHLIGKRIEQLNKIRGKDILEAKRDILENEGEIIFREEFNNLSPKERRILITIANGFKRLSNISKESGMNPSIIGKFLVYLEEKGFVERTEKGIYAIEDPIFEEWLAKKFSIF